MYMYRIALSVSQTRYGIRSTFIQPPTLGTLWCDCARARSATRSEHLQILSVLLCEFYYYYSIDRVILW